MDTLTAIGLSSGIVYTILAPVLRELAAVLLAIAISKDCKARDNGSGALWGIFTLIAPAFFGIIYCVYSRFLQKRKPKTNKDKKKVKSSRKLTISAIIIYIFALIVAGIALVTIFSTGIATSLIDKGESINSLMYDEFYDMNGVKYENGEDVILYDKVGNSYHIEESQDG